MTPHLLPVTIVSGFLGAGKTTLLRRLLAGAARQHTAVLKHELGPVAVDQELLDGTAAVHLEVATGSTPADLRAATVRQLYALAAVAGSYDRLIIETSGAAHPGRLARILLVDSALHRRLRLDGIITVVDAAHFPRHAYRDGYAIEQVACADVMVVNKTDLVSVEAVELLLMTLRRTNPTARYIVTQDGRAPADELLQLGGYDFARFGRRLEDPRATAAAADRLAIATVALTCAREFNAVRFRRWIEAFITNHPRDLVRAKGVVALRRTDERLLFEGVHGSFSTALGRPWGEEERISRLVFNGDGLDRGTIERHVAACVVRPRAELARHDAATATDAVRQP